MFKKKAKEKNVKAEKPSVQISKTVKIKVKTHGDKKGGHPHVIMDDIDDNHISVGFTKDRYKGKNHPNHPLEINPLRKDFQSYMKKEGTVDKKSRYFNPQNGVMSDNDYKKAKKIADKAKEKYLKKKK